jgi:hypothetical protein
MAQFVNDLFSGAASSTLQSHTSDSGGTWAKDSDQSSSAVVLDGNGRVYNNTSGQSVYNVSNNGGPASADYDVFADFSYAGGTKNYADVCARLNTSSFDGYLGGWNDNNGTWTIYRGTSV